ncbi:hypothetical protein ACFLZ7_01230 [Nanoarchaeota archaeon]
MAKDEKTKGQKTYEEVIKYATGKADIQSPFDKKGADLTPALKAKSPQQAAAKVARAFYQTVGHDTSMYEKDEEILGLLAMQVGTDEQGRSNYAKIIAALNTERPDIDAVYEMIKTIHKQKYIQNVVGIKQNEIEQLSIDDKMDVARELQKEIPALKKKKPEEVVVSLASYMSTVAERRAEDEAKEHTKTGENYARGIQDKYKSTLKSQGKPEEAENLEERLRAA